MDIRHAKRVQRLLKSLGVHCKIKDLLHQADADKVAMSSNIRPITSPSITLKK